MGNPKFWNAFHFLRQSFIYANVKYYILGFSSRSPPLFALVIVLKFCTLSSSCSSFEMLIFLIALKWIILYKPSSPFCGFKMSHYKLTHLNILYIFNSCIFQNSPLKSLLCICFTLIITSYYYVTKSSYFKPIKSVSLVVCRWSVAGGHVSISKLLSNKHYQTVRRYILNVNQETTCCGDMLD